MIITHVARLDGLSIWATASLDGYVRIRDDDGLIIRFYSFVLTFRELPFEEKICSLSFANDRGDLLISKSEQIILFKMQDYLPPRYLIEALQQGFTDDPFERIMDFDPTVEFWDYIQISEKKIRDKSRWHFDIK